MWRKKRDFRLLPDQDMKMVRHVIDRYQLLASPMSLLRSLLFIFAPQL